MTHSGNWQAVFRAAISEKKKADGTKYSVYQLWKDTGLKKSMVFDYMAGRRSDIPHSAWEKIVSTLNIKL